VFDFLAVDAFVSVVLHLFAFIDSFSLFSFCLVVVCFGLIVVDGLAVYRRGFLLGRDSSELRSDIMESMSRDS